MGQRRDDRSPVFAFEALTIDCGFFSGPVRFAALPAPVPEPGTLALVASGTAALAALRRADRRRAGAGSGRRSSG